MSLLDFAAAAAIPQARRRAEAAEPPPPAAALQRLVPASAGRQGVPRWLRRLSGPLALVAVWHLASVTGLLPAEVIDRTKGYFPVPGIRHLRGPVLEMVNDTLRNDRARQRGLYRPDAVRALLAAPNDTRTSLGANELWQLAVLEMWLQSMEVD